MSASLSQRGFSSGRQPREPWCSPSCQAVVTSWAALLRLARLEEHFAILADHFLVLVLELDPRIGAGDHGLPGRGAAARSTRSQTRSPTTASRPDRRAKSTIHVSLSSGKVTSFAATPSCREKKPVHRSRYYFATGVPRSVGVGADDFALVAGTEPPPGLKADGVFDEFHRPVAEADVDSARVVARGCGRADPARRPSRRR